MAVREAEIFFLEKEKERKDIEKFLLVSVCVFVCAYVCKYMKAYGCVCLVGIQKHTDIDDRGYFQKRMPENSFIRCVLICIGQQ